MLAIGRILIFDKDFTHFFCRLLGKADVFDACTLEEAANLKDQQDMGDYSTKVLTSHTFPLQIT